MNEEYTNQSYGAVTDVPAETLGRYTAKTFGWMFLGLMVTFLTAIGLYITGAIVYVFMIPQAIFVLAIVELAVVLILSFLINKMSVGVARTLFFVYAILNGIVFSTYFAIYQISSMVIIFAFTALFFGIMAVLGYFTQADFSKIRNLLMVGLLFIIGFWVLSMFMNLERFESIVCVIAIFIFLVFTAYDTQKIKRYYAAYSGNSQMAAKASIFSALQLYLDFINLFLYLLRILGRRRR